MEIISLIRIISNSRAKHSKCDIFLRKKKNYLPIIRSRNNNFFFITVALVFKIKSSVWHQFIKEKLNLLLKKSRIVIMKFLV